MVEVKMLIRNHTIPCCWSKVLLVLVVVKPKSEGRKPRFFKKHFFLHKDIETVSSKLLVNLLQFAVLLQSLETEYNNENDNQFIVLLYTNLLSELIYNPLFFPYLSRLRNSTYLIVFLHTYLYAKSQPLLTLYSMMFVSLPNSFSIFSWFSKFISLPPSPTHNPS